MKKRATIQKRWFHATTKENWKKIQREGVLWGINESFNYRHTFLARNLNHLIKCCKDKSLICNRDMWDNELILSVKYTPNHVDDNYELVLNHPFGWEIVVKKAISLDNCKIQMYL